MTSSLKGPEVPLPPARYCGSTSEAPEEGIHRYGVPEIMNTDQGSQFTSSAFIGLLDSHGIRISMDCKSCWRDNVFVERLWQSIK